MPKFTHNTVEYELLSTSEWTFADAVYAKKVSGGMSVAEIEQGVQNADPDATVAFMAVAIHRVRQTAEPERLREELVNSGTSMVKFFEEITAEEVGSVIPPEAAEAADPA